MAENRRSLILKWVWQKHVTIKPNRKQKKFIFKIYEKQTKCYQYKFEMNCLHPFNISFT